ncbi:hypothetical protein EMCRGX_G006356 [Ephydatia muelleri]
MQCNCGMCLDRLSDRSYVVDVRASINEQGLDEIAELKNGTSEVHLPDTEDQNQASTQELPGTNGGETKVPKSPQVHDQGKEPQVENCLGPHWRLRSKSGVQQGDPLGPLFFSLVLNVLITAIAKDSGCPLLFHAWYRDDGALAGPRSPLCSVLKFIQELGPSLGLHINISKCEVFSCKGLSSFYPEMKQSSEPNLDILGVLLVLLTSAQPSSLKNMLLLNNSCPVWKRLEQLILMWPLHSFVSVEDSVNLSIWLALHLLCIPQRPFRYLISEAINADALLLTPVTQKSLSSKLDDYLFKVLLDMSSIADKARLLSVSSPHAVCYQVVLGLDLSYGSCFPLCPDIALDPLGHHAVTCKRGDDVVSCHNKLRDILAESCRRAHLSVQVEMGNNLTNHSHTRPAALLVPNWVLGKPAAFDLSVTSPLNPTTLLEVSVTTGVAALTTELRKHSSNDTKC